jgi:hypothetical protein
MAEKLGVKNGISQALFVALFFTRNFSAIALS